MPELREHVHLTHLQTSVADKVIVVDPGSLVDADMCHAIATRSRVRLAALGTQVLLTRPARSPGTALTEASVRNSRTPSMRT